MTPDIEKERKAIVQKLVTYARKKLSPQRFTLLKPFIEHYYAYAPINDIESRTTKNLLGAVLSHWELMHHREPGEYKRRIFNPNLETDGWETSHTVLEFILDDQPFLVDTLRTEINRKGFVVHFIVHLGGMKVVRNAKQRITNILPYDATTKEAITEAPIHIEIDRQTNPLILEELAKDLDHVIHDARVTVADWEKMEAQVYDALQEMEQIKPPLPEQEIEEAKAFLKWLLNNHFTFLGYRKYDLVGKGEQKALKLVPNTGLGVLRDTEHSKMMRYYSELPVEARNLALSKQILLLAKTNTRSTVHGSRYTDYVSIKRFNQAGETIGERWFIGLYTSPVYIDSPQTIPVVRLKVASVLEQSKLPKIGHAYKALAHILETLPRDDLFQATISELSTLSMGILQLQDRNCIRLFVRKDLFNRFISCLVYVPRDDFNMELCYRMQDILQASFHGLEISYSTFFPDSILARIHFTIRIDPKKTLRFDLKAIEKKLILVGRSWKDNLHEQFINYFGEESGNVFFVRYGRAFPLSYQEAFLPQQAVLDAEYIQKLSETNKLEMTLYKPEQSLENDLRLKLFHLNETIPLSDAIPILEKMGLRVIGEQPYRLQLDTHSVVWVNDFNMRYSRQSPLDVEANREIFQDALKNIWNGAAEHDGFNALILSAHLNWQEVTLLRAYAKYSKQIGFAFSQDYMEETLSHNPTVASLLVQLFYLRFDPEQQTKNTETAVEALEEQIRLALDTVLNLDEDRILRVFLNLMQATVRTNYFQVDANGQPKSYLSFKLAPSQVLNLPLPHPLHEIFVYSPRFEGVHLRAGKVARGGLRWSDRREDFRREVLGLMKAQQVKNAVIVPAGAKGGFVTKLLPADGNREAILQEGIFCYQRFICGLLDITDNLQDNKIISPPNTVCYDAPDPYLVVAADKGTATFSDIANKISQEYNFWLDDAFASGGSTGYDHKKIAITARGAWESVKRHFQELEIDIETQPFTVVGIGDMAGDVFGNGMLQSKQIKLLAAFNGTHIFIDPNPDASKSFVERQRLFNLPRSTWEDYNPELISVGGGVYRRSLKAIKLSAEVKSLLGIKKEQLPPNELIQAMLKAPVDLLWNGGIGTFVKASTESDLEVGDRSSDAIRVNGNDLQCKVVGEGGNLGFTQLGRIEYEFNGGHINTDFIDNSGGVDCSDHEVNIKILLNQIVAQGQMTEKSRNALLAKMTHEVAQLVLHNNYRQVRTITMAVSQSFYYLTLYERYIKDYARQGKIDPKLEFLPDEQTLLARKAAGKGLTRPETAVLLAYSKIILKAEIIASDLVDDPYLINYVDYAFPAMLRKHYSKPMKEHRLKREIMATQLSNLLITDMGITFVYQMHDEMRASSEDIVRAYVIAREIFALPELWEVIESLQVPVDLQIEMTLEVVRLIRRAVRWLLYNQRATTDVQAAITLFSQEIKKLDKKLPQLLQGTDRSYFENKSAEWIEAGVLPAIAQRVALTRAMYSSLNIIEASLENQADLYRVAAIYFSLAARLSLDEFRDKINDYPVETHWMVLARSAVKSDLDSQQRALTGAVLKLPIKVTDPTKRLDVWFDSHAILIERWQTVFAEIKASAAVEYSMLVVAMRELLGLAAAK